MSSRVLCIAALALVLFAITGVHAQTFTHTEARHTHSIALTPNGNRLLALNTPDVRLSVFDVSNAGNPEPVLIAEIPVGLERQRRWGKFSREGHSQRHVFE